MVMYYALKDSISKKFLLNFSQKMNISKLISQVSVNASQVSTLHVLSNQKISMV